MKSMTRKLSSKGFTLAELLLSVAILAFTLSALLAFYISCLFLDESNRNMTTAVSHGQYAMEEVRSKNFANINNELWDAAVISGKGMAPLNNETINIDVTGIEPLNIKVTVEWWDRGVISRRIILELESLISEQ